jgi:cytochrome c oxidase subunit II
MGRGGATVNVFQSVLHPAGPQAAHIARLWWGMFWTTTTVTVIVLAVLAWAVIRGRRAGNSSGIDRDLQERSLTRVVIGAVLSTGVILFVLLVSSVWTGRLVASLHAPAAVSIDLKGHQWWWEVEYEDALPSRHVITANEIHIPVGHPIAVKVTSRDVIHSFWVPNLHGKRDLIPGYTTAVWLQADQPGTYLGQCAEFCGRQHAKMALQVVAESDADFNKWIEQQRRNADAPQTEAERRGRDVFMAGQCVACHTIHGTSANGLIGPNLTHVASRRAIAAGTLPNTREHLARWIRNPEAFKPGTRMPPNVLADADLQALLTYVETLK